MPLSKPVRGDLEWDTTLNAALDYLDTKPLPVVSVVAVPTTATSTGSIGKIAFDATYLYVCVATNSWVRVARTAW